MDQEKKIDVVQKTLVLIKPDGVSRGLIGDIISRFERVGLKVVAMKMVKIDSEMALKHYGQSEEWFEKIGQKVKEFYGKVGYDAGEDFNVLSNRAIGEMVQNWNANYLTEGAVLAMVLKGAHAVEIVRKIVGSTYPQEAAPGTIRGDYSAESPFTSNLEQRSVRNLIHASGKPEEAETEIQLWFKNNEIFE